VRHRRRGSAGPSGRVDAGTSDAGIVGRVSSGRGGSPLGGTTGGGGVAPYCGSPPKETIDK
jgi:hypothetical protein